MFESLTEKLGGVFRSLAGRGRLTEANIQEACEAVRTALLEADVHFQVAQDFIAEVRTTSNAVPPLTFICTLVTFGPHSP